MEVTSENQQLFGSSYYHCSVCNLTFGNQTAFDSHKPRCIDRLSSTSNQAGNWEQDCLIPVCQIKQEVTLEDDDYEGQNGEEQQPEEEDFLYFCASCNNVYETKHEFKQHKPNCKKGLDKMHVEDGPDDSTSTNRKKNQGDSVVGSSNDMVSEAVTSVFVCSGCPKMFSTAQDLMKHERESFHKKPPITEQPDSTVQVAYPLPNIKEEPIEEMDVTDKPVPESCTCPQCHIQFPNNQELENHRSICNIQTTPAFGQNAILPPEFIKVEPTDVAEEEFHVAPQLTTSVESNYIFSCPRCQIKFQTKIELEDHNKICFLRGVPSTSIEKQQPVSLNVIPPVQIKQEPDVSIEEHPIDEVAGEDSNGPSNPIRGTNTYASINTQNMRMNTADDLASKGMHPCNNCHLTFADKSFLDKHASHCSGSKMSSAISEFSCNWCSRSFSGARFLEKHMPMHFDKFCEEEKPFICDYCNKDFDRKELLVTHIFQHMRNMNHYGSKEYVVGGNNQQCRQSRNKDLAAELAEDFASFRSPKTGLYECKKCPSRYNQPKTLSDHLLVHRENGLFRCSVCPKRVFLTAELLEKHTNEKHKRNSLKCQYCGLQQENEEALQKHLAVHSNALPFQCKYCGEGFSRTTYLNTHCQTKHPEYFPHHCDQCPMVFRQESTLIQHKKVHKNATVDSYTCNVCGQTFVNQQLLGVHKRKHTTESQSHTCQICGLVFKFESTLKVHLTKHNVSKNSSPTVNVSEGNKAGAERTWYTCGVCGQIYLTENGLLSHSLKVHNADPHKKDQSTSTTVNVQDNSNKDGRIWHTCKDCHRIFLTENGLAAHCQKMHGAKSDDSLFCEICSAKFFTEEDMEIHMSAHTDL